MNKDIRPESLIEYLELSGRRLYWGREFSKSAIFYRALGGVVKFIVRLALFALGFYGLCIVINKFWLIGQSNCLFFNL